jgi:hypothetical protein
MVKQKVTLASWMEANEPKTRIIFAETVAALGKAAQAWALVTTMSHESPTNRLADAVEAETQLRYFVVPNVSELLKSVRRLIAQLEEDGEKKP